MVGEVEPHIRQDMKEAELESYVRQSPESIEDGLRFVDHQRQTQRGPLDVLMVDGEGAFVVAELKVDESDDMLVQGLDYYDYLATNVEAMARVYKNLNPNPRKAPRLMLVAPSFSQLLINRCKWISEEVQVSLYRYQEIKLKSGQTTVVYMPVDIPRKQQPEPEVPSQEDLISQIGKKEGRELAEKFLTSVRNLDPMISFDLKPGYISVKKLGRLLLYWSPRKTGYQRVDIHNEEGNLKGHDIRDEEDLDRVLSLVQIRHRSMTELAGQ